MRVSTLYIIGVCDSKSNEVSQSCKALFQKYKARVNHRPDRIELVLLDGDSGAYKTGKQAGKQDQLQGAMLKGQCEIWKGDSGSETNDNSKSGKDGKSNDNIASGKDGKSEVSSSGSVKGRVGVYFVAHGDQDAMYSNTKPAAAANVIVWAAGNDAAAIDKLVILACYTGRVQAADSQSPNSGWKGFVVTLCQVLAGKAPKDVQNNYSGKVTCYPKVAGWDVAVSVYFDGTTKTFTPAKASADAVGRKVIEGGTNQDAQWGADMRGNKNAFQVSMKGALQKLDATGWSDKV